LWVKRKTKEQERIFHRFGLKIYLFSFIYIIILHGIKEFYEASLLIKKKKATRFIGPPSLLIDRIYMLIYNEGVRIQVFIVVVSYLPFS
jgi:hypothetical protein